MIDKESSAVAMHPLFPALGEGPQVVVHSAAVGRVGLRPLAGHGAGAPRTGVHPRGGPLVVVDEEHAPIRGQLHAPPGGQTLRQVGKVCGCGGVSSGWLVRVRAIGRVLILQKQWLRSINCYRLPKV